MNTTIEYFDENAERCFADAFTITARDNQSHFLTYVRPGGTILDLGCGSGRDTGWYTNMNEDRFAETVAICPELEVVEQGTFGNEHPGQPDFRWLYAYLTKH